MNESLYHYSLSVSMPLMLFFGFHMLLARLPEKKIFSNFLLSRRLMGVALLLLAANYSVHLFYAIRLKDVIATILMNMSTYFLCYWLFSSAMMTLLDNTYITRVRFTKHIAMWVAYVAASVGVVLLPHGSQMQVVATIVLAALLVLYGVFLASRLLRTYYRAVKMFENTHSDNIEAYIRWLSVFTYWAVGYGVGCGLLTFLPNEYVFIWILSSIPFYIYLYCRYQNYFLFYEKVENALMEEIGMQESEKDDMATVAADAEVIPEYHAEISRSIEEWIKSEGFCKSGLTLNDLSLQLCTNRTYLSAYINSVYHKTFRDWISDMRIDYAKRIMKQHPQMKLQEVSDSSGFLSLSHFSRTFSDKEGCSPARWRKNDAD